MASPLDTPTSTSDTTSHTFTVSAGNQRALIVGIEQEGTTLGAPTVTYGTVSMTNTVDIEVNPGSTSQRVTLFYLNDAGIDSASSTTIAVSNSVAASISIHAASYQDAMQTTPTNTDTDTSTAATPNPLAACDIVTGAADAVVVSLSGMGNSGTAAWGGTLTERTDQQANATATGSLADDSVPSATTIACDCTWTTQNRAAICALELEHDAGVGITSVTPSEFDMDNADIDIDGSGFGASIGSSDVYLSPNDLLSEAGEVDITSAVNTWSDTQINLDLTQLSAAELTSLQSMGPGARFVIVNVGGVPATTEYFSAVTLHRPQGIEMVLGSIVPGVTTSRLTGMTGTFGGGRAEETAAQNPSTTNTDVASDGRREDVWSIQAKPLSREETYDFRLIYTGSDAVADTITTTPQLTVTAGAAPIDLAASIEGNATTDTNAQIIHQVDSSIEANATVEANIQTIHQIAASIEANATVEEGLQIIRQIASSIEANATIEGDIQVTHQIASEAEANATAEGNLQADHPIQSDIEATATVVGNAQIIIQIASDIEATATTEGDIQVIHQLASDIEANATVEADMEVGAAKIQLAGSIEANATVTGNAQVIKQITASIEANSEVEADSQIIIQIASGIEGTATVEGSLELTAGTTDIAAAIEANATVEADAQIIHQIMSDIEANAEAEGDSQVIHQIQSDVEANATVTGDLELGAAKTDVAGDLEANATVSGDIQVTHAIAASIEATATVEASLEVTTPTVVVADDQRGDWLPPTPKKDNAKREREAKDQEKRDLAKELQSIFNRINGIEEVSEELAEIVEPFVESVPQTAEALDSQPQIPHINFQEMALQVETAEKMRDLLELTQQQRNNDDALALLLMAS